MDYIRRRKVIGSLTTVEHPVAMTPAFGEAAAATSQALGVDASRARAYYAGLRAGAYSRSGAAPHPDR